MHLAVQPAVAIVDDAVHERCAEGSERGVRECEGPTIEWIGARSRCGHAGGDDARHPQRVVLHERVNTGEREALQRYARVDWTALWHVARYRQATDSRTIPERGGIHTEHGIVKRQRGRPLQEPHATWHEHRKRVHDSMLSPAASGPGITAACQE